MRLLLIDPSITATTQAVDARKKQRRGIGYPGLGLYTVAALTPPDIEVKIVDEAVEDLRDDFQPDLVGISVEAPTAPHSYELATRFRDAGIPVVLGGIHVSLMPEEAMEHADAIVVGEAELTWPTLIEDFRRGRLGRSYSSTELVDLDASPLPRRDLMPHNDKTAPWAVLATKGCCPYGCEFCALYANVGYEPRFRSVDRIVEEIRDLPGKLVLFIDENIYANKDFAKRLFRALTPLKRNWVGEATWHIAFDDEALELARDSGCLGLFVGFDSINQQYKISKVPRSGDPEAIYVEAMQNFHAKGLACAAAFVFGFDGDDTTVFERSLNVVREGRANIACFSVLVPYPGTPVFKRLKREGRIIEWDWSKYITPNVCFQPKQMSPEELHEGTLWTLKEFFSLEHVIKTAVRTGRQLGWGMGLVSLKLNMAQRNNWPFGFFSDGKMGEGNGRLRA